MAIIIPVLVMTWAARLHAGTPYFVSTSGSDANDCLTLADACQHVAAALSKASAGDIVIVAGGIYTENLTLVKDVTLIGFGQEVTTLSGGGAQRVITVSTGVAAEISNVTVAGGVDPYAGGIYISGTLRLSHASLTGNSYNAIFNSGVFTGADLTIANNNYIGIFNRGLANVASGAIYLNQIGVWNYGTMRLSNSTVLSHTSSLWPGAGIANYGVISIDHGQIRANRVNDAGGAGIYNAGISSINSTLIISNTAIHLPPHGATVPQALEAWGGGIQNESFPFGTMTITNSVLYGNSANNGGDQIKNGGSALLINVTLSGDAGHHGVETGGPMTLTNVTISEMPSGIAIYESAVARNTLVTVNCIGTMTSLGHNLDIGNTCGFTATGDLTNTNPMLGPLQDNGGPTPTYAIPANSPAVNAGDNVGCPPTDQRGVKRPQAGRCDIGAYEYVFPVGVYLPFVAR